MAWDPLEHPETNEPDEYRYSNEPSDSPTHDESEISEIQRRETLVVHKEKQLHLREKELERREKEIRDKLQPPENWPSSCYPLAYHSIDADIPGTYKDACKGSYYICLLTMFNLIWNFCCLLSFWMEEAYSLSGDAFVWSTIFLLIGVPGAWRLWYRNLYYAFRDGQVRRWFCFFFWFFVHICFSLVAVVGLKPWNLVGIGYSFDAIGNSKASVGTKIISSISAITWLIIALLSLRNIRICWEHYQTSGKSSTELISEANRLTNNFG